MSSLNVLVIADPAAQFLKPLTTLPPEVHVIVSDNPEELKNAAPNSEVILFAHGKPELLMEILPLASRTNWIHSLWTGVEGIITPQLLQHPAPLTNGRGVFRWPLADWVIAAMLFFAFKLRDVVKQQEQGIWKMVHGRMLEGQTLGIVGYGSIGTAAAQRAKAFGMKIAPLRRKSEGVELREIMAASDYILVSTPLTSETRGLIGASEIAVMKPSAIIMNVGRGPVIEEAALIHALQSGAIGGAALDVFDIEPLPPDHPFWKMPNVLLSPHTADRVEGFLAPALECFLDNLSRFREGSPLVNVVEKHAGY
jgi:phosphoglycerate dehydrogenase-like enzyme